MLSAAAHSPEGPQFRGRLPVFTGRIGGEGSGFTGDREAGTQGPRRARVLQSQRGVVVDERTRRSQVPGDLIGTICGESPQVTPYVTVEAGRGDALRECRPGDARRPGSVVAAPLATAPRSTGGRSTSAVAFRCAAGRGSPAGAATSLVAATLRVATG
ncbi:MAG: hypothetical protein QOJ32_3115 [Frankiaceae bacterium]|nr:hypothetical protein [Frankiaceae bacterium]